MGAKRRLRNYSYAVLKLRRPFRPPAQLALALRLGSTLDFAVAVIGVVPSLVRPWCLSWRTSRSPFFGVLALFRLRVAVEDSLSLVPAYGGPSSAVFSFVLGASRFRPFLCVLAFLRLRPGHHQVAGLAQSFAASISRFAQARSPSARMAASISAFGSAVRLAAWAMQKELLPAPVLGTRRHPRRRDRHRALASIASGRRTHILSSFGSGVAVVVVFFDFALP